MKKIFVILAVMLLILTSCQKDKESGEATGEYDIDALEARILESADFNDIILYTKDGSFPLENFYLDYYFGDTTLLDGIEDYLMVVSAESKVTEIGVFKISSPEQKERFELAAQKRLGNNVLTFEPYSEADALVAKSLITGEYKDIFYYIMMPNPEATQELIKND